MPADRRVVAQALAHLGFEAHGMKRIMLSGMGPRHAHQSEEDISEFLFLFGWVFRRQELIDLSEDVPFQVFWSDSNAFDQAFNAHRNAS
jgi:hypothetical protein